MSRSILLLLFMLLASPAYAQEELRHGGYGKPNLMAGLFYQAFVTGSVRDQVVANLSFFPSALSFVPLLRDSRHIRQGSMLDVTAGYRFDTAGGRELRWRGTLLDLTLCSNEFPMDWEYRGVAHPLEQPEPYVEHYVTLGLTLFDDDRSSYAERAIRWEELRIGGGGMADMHQVHSNLEWNLGIGIAASAYRLGSTHYIELESDRDLSGTEASAQGSFTIGYGTFGGFGPFYDQMALAGEVRARRLLIETPLSTLTFRLLLSYRTTTAQRKSELSPGRDRQGIEAIARFERQIVRLGDHETAIEQLQLGLQYSFW